MDSKEKKKLSESDICDLFITPAINKAGWDPMSQIRREVTLTPGPVVVRGNMSSRNKKKKKFADYVLSWEPGVPIAVVEAKDNNYIVSHGIQQALGYAEILNVPSAFSSNGDAFASHNKSPVAGEEIETQFPLEAFPSPQDLWKRYKIYRGIEDKAEKLVVQPYHLDVSGKEPRYYQVEAINRTIEAVASGKKRVLLVMAMGTGKTYTTFQIIWRLWKAGEVKRILFLADRNIDHAERMRVALVNAAGQLALDNPKYIMRITGDSVEGKAELDNFIDPESRFPVIATTSELLTTGVDAKTCKLIVLDKTITSMTSFKQIIGRGTRIDEENNKWFFTIMDFKKATELFRDPDFDGEAVVIYEPGDDDDPVPPDPGYPESDEQEPGAVEEPPGVYKVRVSGVDVNILSERVEYLGPDGNLITESYKDFSRKRIQDEFASLDDFLNRWNSAAKKQALIDELEEHGIVLDNLAAEIGKDYGDFDLICHIAWGQPPLTRKERANKVKKRNYFTQYGEQARAVLTALLDKYADEGIIKLLKDQGRAAVVLPDGFLFGEGMKTRLKQSLLEECNLHTIVRLPNGVFAPYTGIKTNLLFFTKGQPTKHVWYYEHPYPEGVKSYNKTKPMCFEEFETEIAWWGDEADGFKARVQTEQAWKVPVADIVARNYNLDIKNHHVGEQVSHDPDELLTQYQRLMNEVADIRGALKRELAAALERK